MPDQLDPKPAATPTPAVGNRAAGRGLEQGQQSNRAPEPTTEMQPTPTNLSPVDSAPPQRIPHWLQQIERFLRVIVRMYLGLLVCCAPWYPPAWDANPLFSSSPGLAHFIAHGAVRGLVSGLGLLNLWIAVRDALRRPAEPKPR